MPLKHEKLRVLIMSCSALDKSNSAGSTFSNFFEGMEGVELASMYFGYGEPSNDLDMRYFQVTEKSLIRNLLNKSVPSGRRVAAGRTAAVAMNEGERKSFDVMRKVRLQVFFWMRELIWRVGRVHSEELMGFFEEFDPDVIMISLNDTCYLARECVRLNKEYGVPVCAFIGDDIYSLRRISFSPLFWIDRLIKRASHRRLVKRCSKLFVMTELAKREFDGVFGTDCALLTKSLDFDGEPDLKPVGDPVRFVYTGNLYAGRWKSLAAIGSALRRINEENAKTGGRMAELDVWSMTPMTKAMTKAMNTPPVRFMGSAPASEMPAVQAAADVLVHAESMRKRDMLVVRLSFSTKLVDYMRRSRCILAVGPAEQASIAHLASHDAAVTVTEKDDMYSKLKPLVCDPAAAPAYAYKAWTCGAEAHNRRIIQKRLYDELCKAAGTRA